MSASAPKMCPTLLALSPHPDTKAQLLQETFGLQWRRRKVCEAPQGMGWGRHEAWKGS